MTAPREASLLLQVFVAGQLVDDLLSRELGTVGSTPSRFAVESVIGVFGPITPTDLARRLGMAPTTLSTWLRRLRAEGRIVQRPNPADGRSTLVELTPAGREAFEQAGPRFRVALDALFAELGDRRGPVLDGIDELVEALRRTVADTTSS